MSATELRDYQRHALERTREVVRAGSRAPLIVSPTGSGKTRLAVEFAMQHLARAERHRVLWLAHRRELIQQAAQRLIREGIDAFNLRLVFGGRAQGGAGARVTVASIQTLLATPSARSDATLVVIDEAHHVVATEWRAVAAHYVGAIRLGLTATPERADHTPLGDVFDSIVEVTTIRALTAAGWLVPCRVFAPARAQDALSMSPLEAYQRWGAGRPTIVFCASVVIAQELARTMRERSIRAACVDGTTDARVRDDAIAGFARGDIDVLTNVFVLTEGTDLPRASLCILARGCSSDATYLQIVGRVLRPAPGKTDAILADLQGVVHVHGLPDEPRVYSLAGRRGVERAALEPLRTCPECAAVFATAPTCPRCGHAFPPPKPPRISPAEVAAITESALVSRAEKRAYFDQLVAEARAKGWNPKAVGMRFKARFGTWPWWPVNLGGAT